MPCFRPLTAYRGVEGGVSFTLAEAGAGAANPLKLPCGQCIGCRITRSREWAVRCFHEQQLHDQTAFITLTYNDENLPEDRGLHVEHWQQFARALRFNMKQRQGKKYKGFRYFHCGEYGQEEQRPHYHALIYGENFNHDKEKWKQNKHKDWIYTSQELQSVWGKGFCTLGDLTYESAAYCARYTIKKVTGPRAEQAYTRTDPKTGKTWKVKPEYVTMSRRPGIGKDWYDKYRNEIFPADEVRLRGSRYRTPRYYDNQLAEDDLDLIKEKRRTAVLKRAGDLTPERMKTKERHLQLQIDQWKRRV